MKSTAPLFVLFFFCSSAISQAADEVSSFAADTLSKEAREFRKEIRSGHLPLVLLEEQKDLMNEILFYEQDSTERAERAAEIERAKEAKEKEAGDNRSEAIYSVGAIPLEQGVSPSGARTYSIPITTAPGFKLVPSVALAYNSQAAEGWAGYGWDIQGISTISLINQNKYYHNTIKAASDTASSPVFALDGMPLVTNDDSATSAAYPLVTTTGHILARTVLNPAGYVCKFEVLYPNGCRAMFGRDTYFPSHMAFYRIAEIEDILGNRIVFTYANPDSSGNDRISSIRYGFDSAGNYSGEIVFSFTYTSGATQRFFAGKVIKYDYRLSGIESRVNGDLLSGYSFTYEQKDNAYLLSQVDCCNSAGDNLPPLVFTHGNAPSTQRLQKDAASMTLNRSFFSKIYGNVYKRGKFLPGEFRDGIILHPDFLTYRVIGGDSIHGYCYNTTQNVASQKILFIPRLESSNQADSSLVYGEGFQTMEAVDVDGDGADELVRVNFWGTELSKTKYRISIRNCDSDGTPGQESFFYVRLNGNHYNSFYNYTSPYNRDLRWGDFNGDGKTDLLAIAFSKNLTEYGETQNCYAAVIDIDTHRVLSDEVLFDYPEDRRDCLTVCDIDSDGCSELCYASDNGFDIFRLQASGHFVLEKHLSNPTASFFTSDSRPTYLTDINGDGYIDIVQAPPTGNLDTWTAYRYNGSSFTPAGLTITSRQEGDVFMFIDLNKDGLADLVSIRLTTLRSYINKNGVSFEEGQVSPSSVVGKKGIVPANVMAYNGMSAFIKFDGLTVYNYSYSAPSPPIRQVQTVTDSYGKQTADSYVYLPGQSSSWADSSYSPTANSGYAKRTPPLYVLYSESYYENRYADYPYRKFTHKYCDPVVHNLGLGFCGFHETVNTQVRYFYQGSFLRYAAKQSETTLYDPEKRGVPTRVETRLGSNVNTDPYRIVTNTWDNHSTHYGKLSPRLAQTVSADSLHRITTTTSYTYDSFDFPLTALTTKSHPGDIDQKEQRTWAYQHSNAISKYILGGVTQESVRRDLDGDWNRTWKEKSVYTLDTLLRPSSRKNYSGISRGSSSYFPYEHQDSTLLVSETRWTYDAFGNVTSEKSAPYDATEFLGDTLVYDSAGRFLLSKTDALGHTTTYSGYNKYGSPAAVTDYRGRAKSFVYDNWGSLTQTTYADGSVETVSRAWTDGVGSSGSGASAGRSLYAVTNSCTGKPTTIVHYDALGREVHSGDQRFDGQWRWTDRQHDTEGRLSRVSLPYKTASASSTSPYASLWNTYSYDSYNRVTSIAEASGRTTTWSYNGTSTTTVKDGISSTSTTDASGNVVSVTDAGGTIVYTLRDDGQPSSVTAPGDVVTTFSYDGYGRRIGMDDPSVGTRTYSYTWNTDDSSSSSQTGPNGTITTSKDKFGRTTSVVRVGEFNTAYSYDTYGRLSSETSTNGTSVTYTYDTLDRVLSIREDIPDGKWLKRDYSYGAGSKVTSVLYTSQTDTITTELYSYAYGHNTAVLLPDSTAVFKLTAENEFGQPNWIKTGAVSRQYGFNAYGLPTLRKMVVGAGGPLTTLQDFAYAFDPETGNLTARSDDENGTDETFSYDALNRLTSAATTVRRALSSRGFYYEDNGNLTYISSTGTILYDDLDSPYKATSLTNPAYITTPIPRQDISYNSYDRPASISQNGITATLTYNGAEDRVRMSVVDSTAASPSAPPAMLLTRYYIGGRYEIDSTSSTTTERFYLGGDAYSAPMVLLRTSDGNGQGTWTAYNIGRDYLGSITHITTVGGTPVAEYSYDPWGRARNPETLVLYSPGSESELILGRGYTGHEYLPWFGLYNMNARLYDPLVGRFLAPDPFVQAPDFTQNFNRYSYCLNNPLKYSDESGEFVFSLFLGPLGAIIDAACWGALIGGSSYAISTAFSDGGFNNWDWGDFGAAAGWGALSGAVSFGIGEAFSAFGNFAGSFGTEIIKGVSHGLAQGSISALQGGDFWSGALSGTLGSWAASGYSAIGLEAFLGDIGMISMSGLAGGVGSLLNGGSFWEGACIGVTTAGLNHLQHKTEEYKFFERLRRHYHKGGGQDFILSENEFDYLVSKGRLRMENTTLGDDGYYKATMDFYSSDFDLKYSFGTSTVKYLCDSSNINYVGFHDTYNFDPKPWGTGRSIMNEAITRLYGSLTHGISFNIYYNKTLF